MVYLIVLTRQIRKITRTAEKTVDNIESVVSGVSKVLSPMFIVEMVSRFVKKFNSSKKEK